MKFQCDRKELLSGIHVVQRAVATRSTIPILGNILFEAIGADKLRLSAYDLQMGIRCEVPAEVGKEGRVTVPSRYISDLTSMLPDGPVNLELKKEDNTFEVTSGKSRYTLVYTEATEYPNILDPDKISDPTAIIQAPVLSRFIRQTIFATSVEDTRQFMNGSLFRVEEGNFIVVSTDGHRLAKREQAIDYSGETKTAVVPAKALNELMRILPDDGDVGVHVESNQIVFHYDDKILFSRLIEAEYPSYERVIPTNTEGRIVVDREQISEAVRRASIMAQSRENKYLIMVKIKGDGVEITADTQDVGSAYEALTVEHEGVDAEIAYNGRYLQEVLNVLIGEKIGLEFSGPLNPGILRDLSDEAYIHVLMPVRIG